MTRRARGPLYVRSEIALLPFGNESFDSCVSLGALHCLPYRIVCDEVYRVLKPGSAFSALIEGRVIPLFKPHSGAAALRSALHESGFDEIVELKIGRLYACVKGRKP